MYRVVGLREEKYVGKVVDGHNCDFTYTDEVLERHVILLVDKDTGDKVELTLEEEYGECGSGWCTASYGNYVWDKVATFAGKTHTVKEEYLIDVNESLLKSDDYNCKLFNFSIYGGCQYYPSGGYSINFDKFTEV